MPGKSCLAQTTGIGTRFFIFTSSTHPTISAYPALQRMQIRLGKLAVGADDRVKFVLLE